MLDCLIFGDNIAVGLHQVKKECVMYAEVGINSRNFNNKYVSNKKHDYGSEVAIISLGSNDYRNINTYEELVYLRERVKSQRVYWILPNESKYESQSADVRKVAENFNDFIIAPKSYELDGFHPTSESYKEISKEVE